MLALFFLIGLLTLFNNVSQLKGVPYLISYDSDTVVVGDYAVILDKTNRNKTKVTFSYQTYLKQDTFDFGYTNTDIRKIIKDVLKDNSVAGVSKFITGMPRYYFGANLETNRVWISGVGCFKYSWWNGVHKTTYSCKLNADYPSYFYMPVRLWVQYAKNYRNVKTGHLSDIIKGVPYYTNSVLVYAIKIGNMRSCKSIPTESSSGFLIGRFYNIANYSSLKGYYGHLHLFVPEDIQFYKVGNYILDVKYGGMYSCPQRIYRLYQFVGSTNCSPRMLSLGPKLINHHSIRYMFKGAVNYVTLLCRDNKIDF